MLSVCIDSYHVVHGDLWPRAETFGYGKQDTESVDLTPVGWKDGGIRGMFVLKWHEMKSAFQIVESLLANILAFLENFLSLPLKAFFLTGCPGFQDVKSL